MFFDKYFINPNPLSIGASTLWGISTPGNRMFGHYFEEINHLYWELSISSLKFDPPPTKPDNLFNNMTLDKKGSNALISKLCLKCDKHLFYLGQWKKKWMFSSYYQQQHKEQGHMNLFYQWLPIFIHCYGQNIPLLLLYHILILLIVEMIK